MISKIGGTSSSLFEQQCEASSSDGNGNVAFCSGAELYGKLVREDIRLEQQLKEMGEYGTFYNSIFNYENTKAFSFPAAVKGGGCSNPYNDKRNKIITCFYHQSNQ